MNNGLRLLGMLTWVAFASAVTNPAAAADNSAQLKEELVAMGAADQAAQEKMTPFLASCNYGSDAFKAVAQEMAAVDAENLKKLRDIVARSGWPDANSVGSDAGNSAFLVLQHGQLEVQKELLPVSFASVQISSSSSRYFTRVAIPPSGANESDDSCLTLEITRLPPYPQTAATPTAHTAHCSPAARHACRWR